MHIRITKYIGNPHALMDALDLSVAKSGVVDLKFQVKPIFYRENLFNSG